MGIWTEDKVIQKLDEGWLLSGNVGSEGTFRIINPRETRTDLAFGVDVAIIRELHRKGMLAPAPVHGKKVMYRRDPRQAEAEAKAKSQKPD